MAAESCAQTGDIASVLGKLVDMLQHGPLGLALALIVVLFGALAYMYWRASGAGAAGVAFEKVASLTQWGMVLIAVLFVGAIVGPALSERLKPPPAPVQGKYEVSFNIDPSHLASERLMPQIVVAGSARAISFKNGTTQDIIDSGRTYSFNVSGLVDHIATLQKILDTQQRLEGGRDAHL